MEEEEGVQRESGEKRFLNKHKDCSLGERAAMMQRMSKLVGILHADGGLSRQSWMERPYHGRFSRILHGQCSHALTIIEGPHPPEC